MKDREQYRPAQMLKEIWEQEDSCYPANTSPKPHHTDSGNKSTSHYNKNSTYYKPWAYTVRHTDVQIPDQGGDEPDLSPTNDIDPDEIYDEGYNVAVINTANEANKWGRCFNCGKEGHRLAECKEPLKESLKLAKERANREKASVKPGRGSRDQGSLPPPCGYSQGQYGQGRKTSRPTVNSLRVLEWRPQEPMAQQCQSGHRRLRWCGNDLFDWQWGQSELGNTGVHMRKGSGCGFDPGLERT